MAKRRATGFASYYNGQAEHDNVIYLVPPNVETSTETQEELKMRRIERVMDMFGAAIVGLVMSLILMTIFSQVAIWQGWL